MCWRRNANPRSGWHLDVVARRRSCCGLCKTMRAIKAHPMPLRHYTLSVLFSPSRSGFVYNWCWSLREFALSTHTVCDMTSRWRRHHRLPPRHISFMICVASGALLGEWNGTENETIRRVGKSLLISLARLTFLLATHADGWASSESGCVFSRWTIWSRAMWFRAAATHSAFSVIVSGFVVGRRGIRIAYRHASTGFKGQSSCCKWVVL